MQSVILTGGARTGVILNERHRLAVEGLPNRVFLGRNPPDPEAKRNAYHVEDFVDLERRAQTLLESTNWRAKAAEVIARMFLNDQEGDCVWASNFHWLGVASANDPDSTGLVMPTDSEVHEQYQSVCGRGDNGCVIQRTLDDGMTRGWTAAGQVYKLLGYAAVDWTKWDLIRACCQDFGGFKMGINLPSAWTSAETWDVTNTRIVGGHDVYGIDFSNSEECVYLSSWGRIYRITKRALLSTRWLDEAWVIMVPTWFGPDRLAPSGYNVTALTAAMEAIRAGRIPDDPAPLPPGPGPNPPPGPGPGPSPAPGSIGRMALSLNVANWRTNGGNPIADLTGTVRLIQKASDAEEAMAAVNDAMMQLASFVDVQSPSPRAGKINLQKFLMNLMMVLAAYYTKDPKMIYNAVANLANGILQDLNIPFQFPPYPL